jgi:hypothetical protein
MRSTGKNERVTRSIIAVVLAAVFETSAVTMPFVHAHPDDHGTGHHAAHAVHSHFSLHSVSHQHSTSPAISDDDDDRPVYLQLFVAVDAQTASLTAAAPSSFELVPPGETRADRSGPVVKGHDPPFHRSLPSRAPPALLS